jgi:hypothetical protein
MNLRNVLRAYSLLRQLSDDESALLATLRGMNEGERELLVESLQPETARKKPTAPTRKGGCAACDYTKPSPIHHKTTMTGYHAYQPAKSRRASSMAATLGKNLEAQRLATTNDDDDSAPAPICDTCGNLADYEDHSKPSPSYHPFTVKGVAQAAGAGD